MKAERRALVAGVALLAALGVWIALRIDVATDITHFLPKGHDHGDVLLARELAAGELSRTMVLLLDAESASEAAAASAALERELRREPAVAAGLERLVAGSGEAVEDAIWQTFRPHRVAFAAQDADAARALLTDEALDASIAELREQLQTPMSTLLAKVAPEDPLRLLPRHFEQLMAGRGAGMKLVDGRFVTEAEDGAVMFLTTSIPMTDATAMRPLLGGIEAAFARVNASFGGGLALHQSGTHLFALAAEAGIRSDIQRVSIGSAVGLTALFLVVFRSMRLLLLVLPILGAGFLSGTAACLAVFGSVHGLTLAFGAALIGVSVDYAVHFHCHHLHTAGDATPRSSLRRIWPGLGLGALTTITGFLALVASDFPGLRQLAVFAVFGIGAAAISTWLFLPPLATRRAQPTAASARLAGLLQRVWFSPQRSRLALLAPLAAVAAVIAVGLPQLRWNDGIADLNRIDPAVKAEDESVRARVVRFEQRRLVVATGADDEAALRANEKVLQALEPLVRRGALGGFRSASPLLRSAETQAAVEAAVRGDATLWPRLRAALTSHGFVPAAFEPWREFVAGEAPPPLRYGDLAQGPLAQMIAPFRFTYAGGVGFVTLLHELTDEAALRAALEPVERGRVIDIASELGSAYGAYRQRLLQLWLVGLGAVLGLVALRHRALRPTLIAYAPAVLAAAGTAATLTLLGLELNMLSLVALLMVVSMGVDYGVFLAEHRDDPAQRDATMLAVAVAGCTTILGFGLLSLSSQPPLLHIGLTSAIGVLLCLLLAPTVCALATRGE